MFAIPSSTVNQGGARDSAGGGGFLAGGAGAGGGGMLGGGVEVSGGDPTLGGKSVTAITLGSGISAHTSVVVHSVCIYGKCIQNSRNDRVSLKLLK